MTGPVATYDYIVVGAGAAGCVLAARLSEDPATRVLLLEAGPPDRSPAIRIPAGLPRLFGTAYDWDYRTVPQAGAGQRSVTWPSGRTLGGSSATNAMIHFPGHPLDYDTWRDGYGCDGWGYADVLPYLRRAETPGPGGGLRVVDPRFRHRLTRAWVASARAHGLPANPGFRTGSPDGVGFYSLNQRRGRRWSAADAYLRPAAARRSNLTIATGALVTRVEITGGRATGVSYHQDGAPRRAAAAAEVVVCAGAVGSPQLLLHSGIGPADHLRAHGIAVVADVPAVGAGLQDHPRCTALWRTPGPAGGATAARWLATLQWWLLRRGPLASNGGEAGGFLRTRPGAPAPDLQLLVCPPPLLHPAGEPAPPEPTVAVLVTAIAVGSRGRVRLRCADPAEPPAIDPGYLTDPADLAILVAGVQQAREIAAQPPFARLTRGELAPGARVRDRRQLQAWVRENVVTLHHPTSTCAMGGAETAVCDPRLRVRGVEGLRVADASVMPAVPRGNTHAPTVVIAERAADLIRGRAPLPPAILAKTR